MKYLFPLICTWLICSCTIEVDVEIPEHAKLAANFTMTMSACSLRSSDTAQYKDSMVVFTNYSGFTTDEDTAKTKSYSWDFGDGSATTAELNPTHTYHKLGRFTVRLTTYLDNVKSDEMTKDIYIIIGQKAFQTSMNYNEGVDLDATAEKGVMALMASYNSYSDKPTYSLLKTDSLLKKIWMKTITGASVRLKSLKKINASAYILSGNYTAGSSTSFCISKIDSAGNSVWVKYIPTVQGENTYTAPTTDGGFITIGNTSGSSGDGLAVVKLNANGVETWHKNFSGTQAVYRADNIIETGSGYVFASVISDLFYSTIVLTKLDLSGNVITQTSTSALDIAGISAAGVLFSGNKYYVYTNGTENVYTFDGNLTFLDGGQPHHNYFIDQAITDGTALYIASTSNQYAAVDKMDAAGTILWESGIDHAIVTGCGSASYGNTRHCRHIILSGNSIVSLSDGNNVPDSYNSSSVYIDRFGTDGSIQ